MPDLTFTIGKAEVLPFAATPTLAFEICIENANSRETIHSVALRAQIMIEAARRRYNPAERSALRDLFGEPERWSQTLRSLLWCQAGMTIPEFSERAVAQLPVPCTFDFDVAAAKFFHGATESEIPLCFQFSGTVFYNDGGSALQIAQIGWDKEARFRLPGQTWREMMDHYYPNSAWLRLERGSFERLYEYKRIRGFATWEQALDSLLAGEREAVR